VDAEVTESEITIRPFEPGDEERVNRGFNEAFGLDRPLAEWAWKFPPDPEGRLIMIAERDGDVLAHYAGVAVRLQIDGRTWKAAQIVDVYSARKARGSFTRRGVWVQTVDSFFDTFGRSGRSPLLFGFPSPRPLRLGVLQLGYDAMTPQPIRYLARRPPAPAAGMRRRLYRAELARDWEPRLDGLWSRVAAQYPVAVVRDADHAVRRLAGRPGVHYHRFLVFPRFSFQPAAFAAFRTDGGRVRWVDLVWDHDHLGALDLVSHLSAGLVAQTGAELEEMWLNGDVEGRDRLSRLGFEEEPEPGKLVMVARAFDPEIDLVAMAENVYVTMGDSDLV
jgi:hypothetical protein